MENQTETGCCPRFDPAPWDEKEISWENKLFIKDHVTSFLHMPLNFGKVMIRNMKKIEKADANIPENIVLSDEKSLWGSDVFIAVDKEIQDAEMGTISGNFLARSFEGPYQNAGKWAKEMKNYVESKGKQVKIMYFWYTTCPKCAKVYGENHTVIFAEI